MRKDSEGGNSDDKNDNAMDPRRIRRKSNNERTFDQGKDFNDLERADYDKKGTGVFYNKKMDYQKEQNKRHAQLETAPFDHDRKSRAISAPIPILKQNLVKEDLKAPEIEPNSSEKTVFAKAIHGKKTKRKMRIRKKEK